MHSTGAPMNLSVRAITIGNRVRVDLGDITGLAASIKEIGLLQPVVVDGNNNLIAGARRLAAVKSLGYSDVPVVRVTNLKEAIQKLTAERDENTCRKEFTWSEAVAMKARLEPFERKAAEEREKSGKGLDGSGGRGNKKPSGKLPQGFGESRVAVATAVGKAETSLRKAEAVIKAAEKNPELLPVVEEMDRTGNVSKAARAVKLAETVVKLEKVAAIEPPAPVGKFDAIVFDPPWPMEKMERDCRPNQTSALDYPVISLGEIEMELRRITVAHAADNCHVFLWTTQKFLPAALTILSAIRINYGFTMVWHKSGGFQPVGLPQFNCEFCIYGRIGSPLFVDTKAFNLCNEWPRGTHSEKPGGFYDLLRRVTAGRRLDVFNRRRIEGFIGWGKEAA